jgi:FkbM family methyltransferase
MILKFDRDREISFLKLLIMTSSGKQLTPIFLAGILTIGLYFCFTNESFKAVVGSENYTRRHAFFDLGTNNGDSVMYFFKSGHKIAEQKDEGNMVRNYGSKDGRKWDVYIVEANPFFNKSLEEVKQFCESQGHQVFLFTQTAAWIKNEKLTFYLDTVNPDKNYWGSSLIKDVPNAEKSNFTNVQVDGIDVAQLLKRYSPDDEVVMKMDIEGSEFQMIEHLINQQALQLIDIIAVEFHYFVKFPTENVMQKYAEQVEKFNMTVTNWF